MVRPRSSKAARVIVVVVAPSDAALAQWVGNLLQNGPQAMMATKALLQEVGLGEMSTPLRRYTEAAIARVRISPEGQEGLSAFLEKRQPDWCASHD